MVLPVAPLFDLGVDFDVFYAKIWVFWAEFVGCGECRIKVYCNFIVNLDRSL
jgi:hypothetical protein